MTPEQFVAKYSKIQLKETAVSQSHFNDVCALVGHAPPVEYDPAGTTFSFETQTVKPGGQKGFADVYFKGKFIWEYKGPHKDLEKAYQQLQLYREDLQNPPLLITSDIHTINIYSNFNNYPTRKHEISFDEISGGDGLEKLRWAFFEPQKFIPDQTQEQITKATAETFLRVATEMKKHRQISGETYTPEQLAHFLVRLLFCLFAEDLGLLPQDLFTEIVKTRGGQYAGLQTVMRKLFHEMRSGGTFGLWRIRHFNGTLFDDDFVPDIPHDLGRAMLQAAEQDWSQIEPSIFGTLFERIIDERKRAQLGAQYTSESDIMLIVKPVLMEPLESKWDEVRRQADRLLRHPREDNSERDQAYKLLADFSGEIAAVRVLDPASGSGNFLTIALRELLNLQKKVIAYAKRKGLPDIGLTVSPEQLYGIEINTYAHELSQVTVWIGYLQWRHKNGFSDMDDPILRPLHNIQCMDAILAYDDDGNPVEPEWPMAAVIIGNPPFLGSRIMRPTFGDKYCNDLQSIYTGRVNGLPDLVCYWFEKAWVQIENDNCQRAGLIATQGIRGGANRQVLERINKGGNIFTAWSDRDWVREDGATVHVSIVGFDRGDETRIVLDGKAVTEIHPDLTAGVDLTRSEKLAENSGLSFQGVILRGKFNIDKRQAKSILNSKNPSGVDNNDVIKPRRTGRDIVGNSKNEYVIDFGVNTPLEIAQKYVHPIEYLTAEVFPTRQLAKQKSARETWWMHWNPRVTMRAALAELPRYIATPRVATHRIFVWLDKSILPDAQLVVFARSDAYFIGVLHSSIHEFWARRQGTQLREAESGFRYTSRTTFETFPFPWSPGEEPTEAEDERVAEIAHWARQLVNWREAWLNPPRDEFYSGVGAAYEKMLKKRTLTNLYNGLVNYRQTVKAGQLFDPAEFAKVTRKSVSRADIEELDDIHVGLDTAVLDAYGWPHNLTDEEILERLLALNLERAEGQDMN